MNHKALCKILVVCLLINIFGTCRVAFADERGSIVVSAVKQETDKVKVSVSVNNNPGFTILNLDMIFDSTKLIFDSIKPGDILSAGEFTSNNHSGGVAVLWTHNTLGKAAADGLMYEVIFKIAPDAKGDTTINVKYLHDETSICAIESGVPVPVPFAFADNGNAMVTLSDVQPDPDDSIVIDGLVNGLKNQNNTIKGNMTANVINNGTVEKSAVVILCIYDNENRTVKTIYSTRPLKSGDNSVDFGEINVPTVAGSSYKVKLFVWNSIIQMTPLAQPVETAVN